MNFSLFRKLIFWSLLGILIVLISGFGGIWFDRYAIPHLSVIPALNRSPIFQKLNAQTTIINKTEQIVIREDDSIEKIVSQPATAVVRVVSLSRTKTATQDKTENKSVMISNGVLLTNDGLVVFYDERPLISTAVEEKEYTVFLFDARKYSADMVGHDVLLNLTFLRLRDVENTPAIAFANSDDTRVGKKAIAIAGALTSYQSRLAAGIVSAYDPTFNLSGKTVASSEKWEGVMETDMQNEQDFVGGPVIGYNGEMIGLIGVVTLDGILKPFLIPANVVRASFDRALQGTLNKRAIFGAYYVSITPSLAVSQALPIDRGALIYAPSGKTGLAVIAQSPAMQAGIQAGDIILAVADIAIDLSTPLSAVLSRFNQGDVVELQILRNGEEKKIIVTL
ncbi:MAG: S1C family serine protease [Minisyncoccota bacterium]